MPSKLLLHRRTFLRGLGTTLALPLLDSMGWAEPRAKAYKPPVRLGFMYMPHGVIMDKFWPTSPESFLTAPPPALEALRPVLDRCLMFKGIAGVPNEPFKGAPHALELSTWLTARNPNPDRRNKIDIGISADQIAASHVGGTTSLPSLELATMPQTHKENQDGLNEGYYSHCSYSSPTRALPAEINPRNVLNRLFFRTDRTGQSSQSTRIVEGEPLDRQLLDLVLDGARNLRRRLPQSDQEKLEEYLDSVRSVERRIAAVEQRQQEAALSKAGISSAQLKANDSPPIEIKMPEGDKRSEYMQIMCDLTVLAFQSDVTRVCTYIGSTPNGVTYPELGFSEVHHSLTHHNGGEKVGKVAAITEFNISQFAYMVKKMAGLREGDGTLLDNCILMWGSGLEDGNTHTRENLPFIIAGKGGGSVKTGCFLENIEGNQGDLLTTLLACLGVPLDGPVGIGTKQIKEMMNT